MSLDSHLRAGCIARLCRHRPNVRNRIAPEMQRLYAENTGWTDFCFFEYNTNGFELKYHQ